MDSNQLEQKSELGMVVGVGLTLLPARPLIQRTESEASQGRGFSSVVEHLSGKPAHTRLWIQFSALRHK